MASELRFDLSGLGVRFRADAGKLADGLRAEWRPFLAHAPVAAVLDVEVRIEGRPVGAGPLETKRMRAEFGAAACFSSAEGSIEVDPAGAALARLAPGPPIKQCFALINLACAALAWLLPSRGALLLHGAGILVRDQALLLVGPSGSGKSTWSRLAGEAGATVLSDELVLVDGSGERVVAVGIPFRPARPLPQFPGRWPVAALLIPRRGSPARLDPLAPLLAHARLAANLPFVAELLERDACLARALGRILGAVGCHTLTFAEEPSFMRCLEQLLD